MYINNSRHVGWRGWGSYRFRSITAGPSKDDERRQCVTVCDSTWVGVCMRKRWSVSSSLCQASLGYLQQRPFLLTKPLLHMHFTLRTLLAHSAFSPPRTGRLSHFWSRYQKLVHTTKHWMHCETATLVEDRWKPFWVLIWHHRSRECNAVWQLRWWLPACISA